MALANTYMRLAEREFWKMKRPGSRIIRLRILLRFAKDAQVETGLKELIGDAEARLELLGSRRLQPLEDELPSLSSNVDQHRG